MDSHHFLELKQHRKRTVAVQFKNILLPRQETSESPELTDVHSVNSLTEARVVAEYSDLFKGLGKIGGKLAPVVMPPDVFPWQLRKS